MWTKVDKLAIFTNNDKVLKFKNVRIDNDGKFLHVDNSDAGIRVVYILKNIISYTIYTTDEESDTEEENEEVTVVNPCWGCTYFGSSKYDDRCMACNRPLRVDMYTTVDTDY